MTSPMLPPMDSMVAQLQTKRKECSINESFKVREASDADVGIIFGCGKDEYCAWWILRPLLADAASNCIKLDVDLY
jgi:hypothetical protein